MRVAAGTFSVLASIVSLIVAIFTLPLSADAGSAAPLAALFAHLEGVGFCVLALVFAALVLVSDEVLPVIAFCASALIASVLAGPLVGGPLLLAVAGVVTAALRPAPKAEPLRMDHAPRPARLRSASGPGEKAPGAHDGEHGFTEPRLGPAVRLRA